MFSYMLFNAQYFFFAWSKKWQCTVTVCSCSTTHMHPAYTPPTKERYSRQWKHKPDLGGQFRRVTYQTELYCSVEMRHRFGVGVLSELGDAVRRVVTELAESFHISFNNY